MFNIIKLLRFLRSRHPYQSLRCDALEEELTRIAVAFTNQVRDSAELRFLLSEKNADGESALELITYQGKLQMLLLQPVQSVV